eukprot:1702156-Rhodomonas_salina.1
MGSGVSSNWDAGLGVCVTDTVRRHGVREYFAFIATHPMKLMANYLQSPRPPHHPPPTTFP